MNPWTSKIAAYSAATPDHRSGTVPVEVLDTLEELLGPGVSASAETGCGRSTLLLSQLSRRHFVFTVDDARHPGSSLSYVRACPLFRPATTTMVFGPTQRTTPGYQFPVNLDLVLLDGPHAYPYPELEYVHLYPWIATGGLLVLDDIHIPTIQHMYRVLREDDMWSPVTVVAETAFLRRTAAPTFPTHQDRWAEQVYNRSRFPMKLDD